MVVVWTGGADARGRLVSSFLPAVLFLSLACIGCLAVDTTVSDMARTWDLPGDLQKAISLSEAFAHGSGVTAILGAVWLVAIGRRQQVGFAILLTVLSGVTANGLKSCLVRVRPYATDQIVVADQSGLGDGLSASTPEGPELVDASFWDARQRSFPSGHTATAWGLAIGLSLVFPRGLVVFALLASLASFQRILAGAHFPSDVLAGAAIAFLWAWVLTRIPRIRNLLDQNDGLSDPEAVSQSGE